MQTENNPRLGDSMAGWVVALVLVLGAISGLLNAHSTRAPAAIHLSNEQHCRQKMLIIDSIDRTQAARVLTTDEYNARLAAENYLADRCKQFRSTDYE